MVTEFAATIRAFRHVSCTISDQANRYRKKTLAKLNGRSRILDPRRAARKEVQARGRGISG